MPAWRLKGRYLKNCDCIATCPCDTVGVPYPGPGCEGMNGMYIDQGHFGEVKLDGVAFAFIYRFPGALHEGNGTLQPFVDSRASPAQRDAVLQILSGKHGGTIFEIFASLVTQLLEPQFLPIQFEFDKRARRGRLAIEGVAEAVAGPLTVPATGGEQRVTVRMPDGFEYKEMEVAQAMTLRSSGPIAFDHRGTNANLAEVEHTQEGLVA
jgi:hypothetical protein